MRLTRAVLYLGFLLLPAFASAHSTGPSLEKQVGPYLVDVGYSSFDPVPGQEFLFNALLVKNPGTLNWEIAPYNRVEVEIRSSDGNTEPFKEDTTLRRPIRTVFTYAFPKAGDYTFDIRFSGTGGTLAEASFPITITSNSWWSPRRLGASLALGIFGICLACVGYVMYCGPGRFR